MQAALILICDLSWILIFSFFFFLFFFVFGMCFSAVLMTACLGLRGERKEQGFCFYTWVLLWSKVFFGLGASHESLNGMATLRKKRWISSISCLGFLLLF
jgi:hypothetical protein